ncbi:MAG: hypothetical protein DI605_19175 [Sphingomonas sp.]|nr:MAG: hypothetical protein DI605_19175 [Sphingomonas sp.]
MPKRKVAVYYAWSRVAETDAPLPVIENRFPALFESRRMLFPRFEELSDPERFDQGIAGFLDHIMKQNFTAFVTMAAAMTGHPVIEVERVTDDGRLNPIGADLFGDVDTLIIIGFDSLLTDQRASAAEMDFVRGFLSTSDHLLFVGPHHDIGETGDIPHDQVLARRIAEFAHHGDRTIPPQQGFGGLGRSLLAGLGLPVENRFGLHPAALADGRPAPIEAQHAIDRLSLLAGVSSFNLHPHLPHFERRGDALAGLEVLARQKIDPAAPPHPFTAGGRTTFDALLQSSTDAFPGTLLVGDATLWSSTAGGLESLHAFWTNVVQRPRRGDRL